MGLLPAGFLPGHLRPNISTSLVIAAASIRGGGLRDDRVLARLLGRGHQRRRCAISRRRATGSAGRVIDSRVGVTVRRT